MIRKLPISLLLLVLMASLTGSAANAQVDSIVQVVSGENATGGKSISSFAYDPLNDLMFVTSFGFNETTSGNSVLRKIENINGVQTSTAMISEGQQRLFYQDGDNGETTAPQVNGPMQNGILLNPVQIGDAAPYSFAIIADQSSTFPHTGSMSTSARIPETTKRFYTYNLQAVAPVLPSPTPPYNDGRDVYTTRVTLAQLQAATGATGKGDQAGGRQFVWSGDGQSIYFNDASSDTGLGGIWKLNATTWTPTRLLAATDINTEPAVVTSGGVDTIFFRGGAPTNNIGGIDKITYDGTTVGSRTVHVSAAELKDFLQTTTNPTIPSMTSDAAGNIYFGTTTANRRGIFRIDPQGRISKVFGGTERTSLTGGTNSQTLRMQSRTTTFVSSNGSFPITQILFADSDTDGILGANVFEPGDFNRDNLLDAADIDLFKPQLTLRDVIETNVADLKFDMNGNNVVDWKDVKVLQQFADFGDGDVDLNGIVDMADYAILQANWLTSGKTFIQGDLSGDDLVNLDDYNLWAASAGYKSSVLLDATFVGLPGDADGDFDVDGADFVAWQTGFPATSGGTLGAGDLDGDLDVDGGDFAYWQSNFPKSLPPPPSIPGTATVPEPATGVLAMAAFGVAAALQLRRRKQS